MRLFIGIPLENKAQEELTSYYKHFKDLKTVRKENLHITLQFLGDMEDEDAGLLKKAVDKACEGFRPFEAESTRISGFPALRNAKAVWANVDRGGGAVKKLFTKIEKCLEGIKYEREKRAFIPHITIGRSKPGIDITKEAAELKFRICTRVGKLVLYGSVLEPDGPVYSKIYEKMFSNLE